MIMKGGAAQQGLHEGDIIESIDGHVMARGAGVDHCSSYIRGAAGSYIEVGSIAMLYTVNMSFPFKCVLIYRVVSVRRSGLSVSQQILDWISLSQSNQQHLRFSKNSSSSISEFAD